MKKKAILKIIFLFCALGAPPLLLSAQSRAIDAKMLIPKVSVSLSPRAATFTEDSIFEVPVLLNTKGFAVNGIDVKVTFDPNKLYVVKPSSGQSIIGVWTEPPSFDNTKGVVSYVGVVPNGINTQSGLIGTISFKSKIPGKTSVNIKQGSTILLNDGFGSEAVVDLGRAEYTIIAKMPEGVKVFSETHPFSGDWYNNRNPFISWEQEPDIEGFSYILDNKPSTIPENKIITTDTNKAYEDMEDGLWYFHIKAYKKGIWGNTTHFLIRIDATPPAVFQPEVNYILAATASVDRTLVSFYTTDNLSGVKHYEVGVVDKSQPITKSPVFIQTEGPFQTYLDDDKKLEVIVRAVDNAGNVRDATVDIKKPTLFSGFVKKNLFYILLGIAPLIIIIGFFYYIFSRRSPRMV